MEKIYYTVCCSRDWDGDPGFCYGVADNLKSVQGFLIDSLCGSDEPDGWKKELKKWWPGPSTLEAPSRPDRYFYFQSPNWDEDRFVIVQRHLLNM